LESGTAFSAALKPIFECVPSQNGFSVDRAAATKRHSSLGGEFVSIYVDQFHFARHNVRAVLDCFDFDVSHDAP
jgi:hypothetical protein